MIYKHKPRVYLVSTITIYIDYLVQLVLIVFFQAGCYHYFQQNNKQSFLILLENADKAFDRDLLFYKPFEALF